jgi:hypothetical protein
MFSIESEKVDVTASNDTAIINSEFLSHFSKIREVGLAVYPDKNVGKKSQRNQKNFPHEGTQRLWSYYDVSFFPDGDQTNQFPVVFN